MDRGNNTEVLNQEETTREYTQGPSKDTTANEKHSLSDSADH